MINRLSLFALFLMGTLSSSAQSATMADAMRDNGKIYVVVGVLVIIFAVLFGFLLLIERRLRKLENDESNS